MILDRPAGPQDNARLVAFCYARRAPPWDATARLPAAAALALVAAWACLGGAPVARTQAAQGELAPVVAGHRLTRRWVMVQNNFQAAGNVERVNGILDRAQAAGYNGALVGDVKFGRLDDGSLIPAYFTNLRAVLDHARALGMQVVPGTADFGYSESILWHDPNLAEGLPVRDATFVVRAGQLQPYEAAPLEIANGDFEDLPVSGDTFPGWAWQDKPGEVTFVDRSVRHSGRASLRMTDIGIGNAPSGNGRIEQRLAVRPFQYYHVSVWVRTEAFGGGEVRVLALGQNPTRTLQWNDVPVAATQDWTRFDVTFNTLTHDEVLFYLGVWGGTTGTIWWDDARIEPAGFVNLVRRPGAPLALHSAADGQPLAEGVDVAAVEDPEMGRTPWPGSYDLWHDPPEVAVPEGSRLREGDLVLADYYHMATVYGSQVAASLTEPASLSVVHDQLASLQRVFGEAGAFSGWMLEYDEIRVHGWDQAPVEGATPGQHLAAQFGQVYGAARGMATAAELFTWSDMFDPYHNAAVRTDPYYLVNGDWSGSWAGVPADVTIVNWNSNPDLRRQSAAFFAARGNRQILAGYYDAAPGSFRDRQWLADLEGLPGIDGVMYTQWSTGYDMLEAWAEHVWGGAEWTAAGPAAPIYLPYAGR
jgi:hypothetical protein